MPDRKSVIREQQLTTNLRRSPRFLRKNPSVPVDPSTRVSTSSRTRRISSPHTPPSSSTPNILIQKKYSEEGSGNVNESNTRSRISPIIGSRRSARLIGRNEEFSYVELSPEVNEEKRVTRSSSSGNANSKVKEETRVTQCSTWENIDEVRKEVGVKRKRSHAKKDHWRIVQGWTKDQELALERAYFAAKPTPQFWKKVARLVPGKSAQDCFDKVHSNHMTPPQPQPRSRIKAHNSSPLSISASKLLNSLGPKVKRCRKAHLVQKAVRHMLQKQCQVDQDSEADLFSVLEHRTSPSARAMQHDLVVVSTPVCNQEKSELLKRCRERSSSANRKSLSRFSVSSGTALVSPPVLKQVKNKGLHERYIDLLHCRETNRKAAVARAAKYHQGNGLQKESQVQRKDAIKDSKNALVFDATDAIKQFQHLQADAMMSSLSDDDDGTINYEDEGEDVF